MIARRAHRDHQIFGLHRVPREIEEFKYRNLSMALADVAVTSMFRYLALAGKPLPFHLGIRTLTDKDAPWCILHEESDD